MAEAPFSLQNPAGPLKDLLEGLGLGVDPRDETLDTLEIRGAEVDPRRVADAFDSIRAAVAAYGSALGSSRLRFADPATGHLVPLDLDQGLTFQAIRTFIARFDQAASEAEEELRLFLDLEIHKAVLARDLLGNPRGVRPALIFQRQALENLLLQSLKDLEAWWDARTPAKLVILVPEWEHTLDGRYLAVIGKNPLGDWKAIVAEPAPGAPGEEDEALGPAKVYTACRTYLWWKEEWTTHLTPLHLATEGDAPPGDPIGDRIHIHLANLCLLFTADRTEGKMDEWLCTFTEAGEQAEVATASPERSLSPESAGGVRALVALVRWAYSRYLTSDRLGFLQIRIARELRGSLPSERYDRLLQQAVGILERIQPDWKMFMEGRIKEFSTQVKALEDDVAKTVESFSSQIAAMTKSLSDTMLGAVAVLLGAFIAALVKQDLRLEILTVTVAIYVGYLLLFPLTYNMRERWGSYQVLRDQFEARRERSEGGLSREKVEQIVGDHVARSDHRFRRWFFLVAFTYLLVAGALVQSINIARWLRRSPIESFAYKAPPARELAGPLAPNKALATARPVGQDRLVGAEDVAVKADGPDGRLYTGTADGRIVRVTLKPGGKDILEVQAQTGGRPLGLRFGPDGRTLFVADAKKGLLAIDQTGRVKPLATAAGGVPFGFTDDLDVAPDGTIYFSDASSRFGVDEYLYDLLEARPHGRLLKYDPKEKWNRVSVLLDGLYFANGVALASDQRYVLVNETYRYRIRRYWLKGPKAGTSDFFITRLPGFPDNLSRDPATGRFWVALYTVRNPVLDFLHPRPFLKDQLARLPRFFWPKPEPYGLVLSIDEQGRIVESLHDPGGESVRTVTSVEAHGGKLYLGSLHGPIAVWEP
jgi:sugar lactone lactonase YvrE